ncbi:ribosomal protein L10-domain-containing protein [Melampsora americana]|nr:ribosomal protein L10-domain-containing protein [Melampsora americana]
MPRSSRATVVHLTKTSKKTKEAKGKLIEDLKLATEKFKYAWLFTVDHVRTTYLQEIRSAWKPARIFLGRNAVMRLALGSTPENEHMPGTGVLGKLLEGDTGLLFTDEDPKVVIEWFDDFVRDDYARKGNVATETVELPEGPVMIKEINDDPSVAPGAMEPHLRALGLPTTLQRGVPTLNSPYTVCSEGDTLTTQQAGLLKTLGHQQAKFKVVLRNVWVKESSKTLTLEEIQKQV